ncbi:MAG: DUF4065 domain-containing protein [Alphaproteobacteria bacterium]|jgi:uncharacterized phage-associated protein|nr:DUF4065 domain-containing protein [Alphaproteobacteria bacterium]
MYSIIAIADEILRLAKKRGWALTPLQLMKLSYIANGWSLAIRNQKLFDARIEAWKYGPVMPDLYQATKKYGRDPIPLDLIEDEKSTVDGETSDLLDQVVEKYGKLTAYSLSSLTHKSGSPWDLVYRTGRLNAEIPDDSIRAHYLEKMNDGRDPAAA